MVSAQTLAPVGADEDSEAERFSRERRRSWARLLKKIFLSMEAKWRAFELRDRVSERERLYISAHYYGSVTGEDDKALNEYQVWKQTYPRDWTPYNNLAFTNNFRGDYQKSLSDSQEAVRINPNHPFPRSNLAHAYMGLNRFEEAKAVLEKAVAENVTESGGTLFLRYQIAFVERDTTTMQRLLASVAGKPVEAFLLSASASGAAFNGQAAKARELTRRAVELGKRSGFQENAAAAAAAGALMEALFGNPERARKALTAAMKLGQSERANYFAGVSFALSGSPNQAESLAEAWAQGSPMNTFVNEVFVPTIHATAELARGKGSQSIELLKPAAQFELGMSASYVPVYVRGQA